MNIKRFIRKNYMLILVLVLIVSSYYYICNYEPFQAINLGTCVTADTSKITVGTCPSGYIRDPNRILDKCLRNIDYCGPTLPPNSSLVGLQDRYNITTDANGNKKCEHKTTRAISAVKVMVYQSNYTCPAGLSRISGFRCAPIGNLTCPSPSRPVHLRGTASNGTVHDEKYCLTCPPTGTVPSQYNRDRCISRADKGKLVTGTRVAAVCSV